MFRLISTGYIWESPGVPFAPTSLAHIETAWTQHPATSYKIFWWVCAVFSTESNCRRTLHIPSMPAASQGLLASIPGLPAALSRVQNIPQHGVNGNNYHKLLQPCHVKVQNIPRKGLNGNNYHKPMHVLLTASCNCTSMLTWFTHTVCSFLQSSPISQFPLLQSISSIPSAESTQKIVTKPKKNFTYNS